MPNIRVKGNQGNISPRRRMFYMVNYFHQNRKWHQQKLGVWGLYLLWWRPLYLSELEKASQVGVDIWLSEKDTVFKIACCSNNATIYVWNKTEFSKINAITWKGWESHCEMEHNKSISVHAGWRTVGRRRGGEQKKAGGVGGRVQQFHHTGGGGTGYTQVRGWTVQRRKRLRKIVVPAFTVSGCHLFTHSQSIAGGKFSKHRHLHNVSMSCHYKCISFLLCQLYVGCSA